VDRILVNSVILVIEAELAGSWAEPVLVLAKAHDILGVIVTAVFRVYAARQSSIPL